MNLEATNKPTLIVIGGPTAVGKTSYAIEIAKKYKTSIISADSRQFYKEMRIGTSFPTEEELSQAPHHFVGHLSITDYYSVSKFEQDVLKLLPTLFSQNPIVIMTGGSGLYLDAVCKGIDDLPDPDLDIRQEVINLYENEGIEVLRMRLRHLDPAFCQNNDLANHKRMMRALEVSLQTGKPYSEWLTQASKKRDFDIQKYYLNRPREILFDRINRRVDQMMEQGLLDEARSLYPYKHLNSLNTVGYKELFAFFDHQITLEEAIEKIKVNTRRYAKRQITWFKREYTEIMC